ncbi:MAG TPA: RbsD/FucU family protein [Planctomycetota bacterium]|jgi:D-ribose pyranase
MTQWEYKGAKNPELATLGDEGWELVTVRPDGEYIFKRPAPPEMERYTREQTENALAGRSALCPIPRLLNPELAALARRVGHTQMLVVCDRGFPAPLGLPLGVFDVSVTSDVPTIPDVLGALLPELPHDRIIVAREMRQKSPDRFAWHKSQVTPVEIQLHAELKHLAHQAVACIRTGDSTPYGNVIIVGG